MVWGGDIFCLFVGIGYHTAYDFAKRRARVILACRNIAKGEEAAGKIKRETGNENVVARRIDLSCMKSVRDFAANILSQERRLDILVNNAGVVGQSLNLSSNLLSRCLSFWCEQAERFCSPMIHRFASTPD